MNDLIIKILESPEDIQAVEEIQRQIWSGSETDVVPAHMLLAAIHSGGLIIGAFLNNKSSGKSDVIETDPSDSDLSNLSSSDLTMIGFVFGFPGLYTTADGPRLKHHSHMLGVLPEYRDKGAGFRLKRAQWQMVRHQGLDRITWTYDPLLSRNAHLNITRLGAVCNTYLPDYYGEMRDGLNAGIASDRFQVDWWVNSKRVARRMSKHPRQSLDLAHYLAAEISIINPTQFGRSGFALPKQDFRADDAIKQCSDKGLSMLLVEIPADFLSMKASDPDLATEWRVHSRSIFVQLFQNGYIVTDSVYLPGKYPRSFYVLSDGESTL